MSHYKLIYFNARGKAEVARLIFAAAGQEYEDFRFEREEWPNHKPNMPFGQVPVLEIKTGDEVVQLAQSNAIYRYLARKFNLAGQNDLELAKADMVVDQLNDLLTQFSAVMYEQNEEKKQELREKLYSTAVPQNLDYLEKLLEKSKTQYFAGDELTYADLAVSNALERLGDKKEALLETRPLIKAVDEKVRTHAKVAEWLEKRPKQKCRTFAFLSICVNRQIN